MLTFNGTNLDVVQNPILVIDDPQYLIEANVSAMTVLSTIMTIFHGFVEYKMYCDQFHIDKLCDPAPQSDTARRY